MMLGPHAIFIVSSYLITALVVGCLIVWIAADLRTQRRILADLDAGGIKRRSQGNRENGS